jgi:hypothetical protein
MASLPAVPPERNRAAADAVNHEVTIPSTKTAGADECVEGPEQVLGPGAVSPPITAFGDLRSLVVWRSPEGVELRLFDSRGNLLAQPVTPNLPRYSEPRHVVLLPQRFVVLADTETGCADRKRCRNQTYAFSVGLNAEVSTLAELALDGQRVLFTLPSDNERAVLLTERSEWIDLTLGGPSGFAAVGHALQLMPYVAPIFGEGEPLLVTADWRGRMSILGAEKRWDVVGPTAWGAMEASVSTRLFATRDQDNIHVMWTTPPQNGQREVHYGQLVGDELQLSVEKNTDLPVRPPFDKYVFAQCCEGDEFTRRSWPDDALRGVQQVQPKPGAASFAPIAWNGQSYLLLQQYNGQLTQTAFDCSGK